MSRRFTLKAEFPRDVAEQVRRDFPGLWKKHGTGGNPPTRWTGDDAFTAWGWATSLRAGRMPARSDLPLAKAAFEKLTGTRWVGSEDGLFEAVVELWIRKRVAYMARHARDFRSGGIVAMIKWGGVFPWAEAQALGAGHLVMLEALGTPRHNAFALGLKNNFARRNMTVMPKRRPLPKRRQRRNPVRTAPQPDLFGGPDFGKEIHWTQATPAELVAATQASTLTNDEIAEMRDLVEAVEVQGDFGLFASVGVSERLGTALLDGLVDDLE